MYPNVPLLAREQASDGVTPHINILVWACNDCVDTDVSCARRNRTVLPPVRPLTPSPHPRPPARSVLPSHVHRMPRQRDPARCRLTAPCRAWTSLGTEPRRNIPGRHGLRGRTARATGCWQDLAASGRAVAALAATTGGGPRRRLSCCGMRQRSEREERSCVLSWSNHS